MFLQKADLGDKDGVPPQQRDHIYFFITRIRASHSATIGQNSQIPMPWIPQQSHKCTVCAAGFGATSASYPMRLERSKKKSDMNSNLFIVYYVMSSKVLGL